VPSHLDHLTPEQYAAAVHASGPACVLAGAGTGKTSVIAAHVQELIALGVSAETILLLTFTNKAARELAHRAHADGIVCGTFHSIASRLCREFGSPSDSFKILDDDDSYRVVRGLLGHGIPAKEAHETHDLLMEARDRGDGASHPLNAAYEDRLESMDSLDFPGLLLALRGLCERRDLRQRYQHVIVDEYQDTSPLQDQIVTMLARHHGNPFVVGDDGQAIYQWRGADPRNILEFSDRWLGTTLYKLQGNFRSGQGILNVANTITAKGDDRFGKRLFAMRQDAPGKLVTFEADDPRAEATRVVSHIARRLAQGAALSSHAILVRAAYQFPALETELVRSKIPYRVAGGPALTARAEARDAIAYLRAWADHRDDLALSRILNVPPRGIGPQSAALIGSRNVWEALKVQGAPQAKGKLSAMLQAAGVACSLKGQAAAGAMALVKVLDGVTEQTTAAEVLSLLLVQAGYQTYAARDPEKAEDRIQTLDQLHDLLQAVPGTRAAARKWCQDVALAEAQAKGGGADVVTVSTIHAAKGLEWGVVYACGWEAGTFPNVKSDAQEERRLAYVAVTRARDLLVVGWCRKRHGEEREAGLHWGEIAG